MQPATPDDELANPDAGSDGEPREDAGHGDATEPSAEGYVCPHCNREVEAAPPGTTLDPFITCPHCGNQFAQPVQEDAEADEEALQEARSRQQTREEALDSSRIQNLTRQRRARIRARSYGLIAFVACAVVVAELVGNAVVIIYRSQHVSLAVVGYILFAAAGVMAAVFFFRRVREMTEELKLPPPAEPATPPDFSTLNDGSQHWKDLEKM